MQGGVEGGAARLWLALGPRSLLDLGFERTLTSILGRLPKQRRTVCVGRGITYA